MRELDSDDAVYILEDLPKEEQAEILDQLPPPERVALERSLRLSGGFRRPAHADRVHRRAAVLDRRPHHRLHARDRRSAGPLLRDLRRRRRPAPARRGRARPAAAHQAAGADRRADGRGPPARPRHRRPGGGGAHVRALQSGRRAGGRRRATGWSASSPSTTSST